MNRGSYFSQLDLRNVYKLLADENEYLGTESVR